MTLQFLPAAVFTIAVLALTGCSAADDNTAEPAPPSGEPEPTTVVTNARGAVEVPLGDPVTLIGDDGNTIVTISNSQLDTEGCKAVDYADIPDLAEEGLTGEIRQVKFKADVEVGDYENPEWLWSSDFYFVGEDSLVTQNVQVDMMHSALLTSCEGSQQILNLPPNSKARGSVTLSIPVGSVNGGPDAIGYNVDGKRAEWVLPEGWVESLGEPVFTQ